MEDINPMWLNGHRHHGSGPPFPVENPASGEIFAYASTANEDDIVQAVKLAHGVFQSGVWSRCPRERRAQVLENAGKILEKHIAGLVDIELQQTGRCFRELDVQLRTLPTWFSYYASVLRTEERSLLPTTPELHNWVERVPLGVVAQITPFNHPLLIAVKKLVPALAAGNSVMIKPSELTPLTTVMLGPILQQAGLPDGVFNVITGEGKDAGQTLISQPYIKKVDITGSTSAGRAVGAKTGQNLALFTAELGGKAPLVVFESADTMTAVNGIAFGSFIASGQTCIASTRIIVQNSIMPQLLDQLKAKVELITRRIDLPQHPMSMMGPLISARNRDSVEGLVHEAVSSGHASILVGGNRMTGQGRMSGADLSKGYFYEPTVLISGSEGKVTDSQIWKREAFGPVIVVVGFDSEEEAIALANDTEFSLGASIWTQDFSQFFRVSQEINAGIIWINTHHRNHPSSPWGALGAPSGVGSENGVEAYYSYTAKKSIVLNLASPEMSQTDDWFREEDGPGEPRYG